MTLFDWIAAIGGGFLLWLALAVAVGIPIGRAIRRADEREVVDWTPFRPEVPRSERAA